MLAIKKKRYPVSCDVSVLKAPVSLLLVVMVWSTTEVLVAGMVGSSEILLNDMALDTVW